MLTAARLREYTGRSAALDLFRDLGYPVAPVEVNAAEWRRGGVGIPWNGEARLHLAARRRQFDLFLLQGEAGPESIAEFLSSYRKYNLVTKSVLIYQALESRTISVFDLSSGGTLRRMDIDFERPVPGVLDRLNLLACDEASALPRIFDRALDREGITRQFFQRFRAAVREVASSLAASFPGEEPGAVDGQALLILSRVLFLSFVQEKGWLNGERRFLVDRLEHETAQGHEYFSGVLVPLFFGCLNTPVHERTLDARRLGAVPYLNGGLFEPSRFERRHDDIRIPNALMGRILDGVFERFDFRTTEGDSAGTHVDPEMLGKVFESLMAADERLSTGSYYTPREIVDVLTRRAVTEWLHRGETGPGRSPVELLQRLENVTILDPACGSGAFLLSALGVVEQLWRELAGQAGVEVPRDLRRRIVARSLYGVDLKPEAVRLCELRLWLAIVSGTDATVEEVEPLPNLDRNILQGNSLFTPTDFLGDARTDIYAEWLEAMRAQRDLLERYRTAPHGHRPALHRIIRGNDQRLAADLLSRGIEAAERELEQTAAPRIDLFGRAAPLDAERCRELHQRVTEGRRLLERVEEGAHDFFSFDVHFAPVMATGGFDIVLGNPPWVRNSRIEPRARRMLGSRYPLFRKGPGASGFHQPDLSIAFFERAIQLASPEGVVALLMPAKIANAAYAAPLRRTAEGALRLVAVHDWSDDPRRRRWFEADTFPLGLVLSRLRRREARVEVSAAGETFVLAQEEISSRSPLGEWALVPPRVGATLRRLRARHRSLEEVLGRRPFMGVKTGDNNAFFLDVEEVREETVLTTDGVEIPKGAVCRCVRGRDLRRWNGSGSHWMLWPPAGGWRETPRWLARHAAVRGVTPDDLRLSFVKPEHVGIKVAWKDLSRGMAAAVLPETIDSAGSSFVLVPNQTLYAIDAVSHDEAHALAAILNSSVVGALLLAAAERAKDGHYRYFGRTVAAVPLADMGEELPALAHLSRRARLGAPVDDEIDAAVAKGYGLTSAELAHLREFVERRTGARSASG